MQDNTEQQALASEKFREQIAVIQASWNRWLGALASLPEQTLIQPATCDLWSVKDVMAHISAWDVVAVGKTEDIVANINSDNLETTQQFNDRVADEARDLPIDEVRRAMMRTHNQFIAALHAEVNRPMPMLERIEAAIAEDTHRHYDQHAQHVMSLGSVNG